MPHNKNKQTTTTQQPQNLNDRQFRCKCDKVYKSYPALYTHIKNKHPDRIEQFKNDSKRPKQGEIDKGRPKKIRDRPVQADQQGDLLNIIELGILSIERTLKDCVYNESRAEKFQVLLGNAKLNEQQLRRYYDQQKTQAINKIKQHASEQDNDQVIVKLTGRSLVDLKNEESVRIFKEEIRFKNELVQHFNAVTAAKILIHLELLQIEEEPTIHNEYPRNEGSDLLCEKEILIKTGQQALWGRKQDIVKVIRGIYSQWHSKLNSIRAHVSPSQKNSVKESEQDGEQYGEQEQESHEYNEQNEEQQTLRKQNELENDINSCFS